jgi:hypothetical protein
MQGSNGISCRSRQDNIDSLLDNSLAITRVARVARGEWFGLIWLAPDRPNTATLSNVDIAVLGIVQILLRARLGRSAELIDLRVIDVIRRRHFFDQQLLVQVMALDEVLKRVAVVPQLGIEQAEEEMWIHRQVIGEIHPGKQPSTVPKASRDAIKKS